MTRNRPLVPLSLTCHRGERLIYLDEPANRRQGDCHLHESVRSGRGKRIGRERTPAAPARRIGRRPIESTIYHLRQAESDTKAEIGGQSYTYGMILLAT